MRSIKRVASTFRSVRRARREKEKQRIRARRAEHRLCFKPRRTHTVCAVSNPYPFANAYASSVVARVPRSARAFAFPSPNLSRASHRPLVAHRVVAHAQLNFAHIPRYPWSRITHAATVLAAKSVAYDARAGGALGASAHAHEPAKEPKHEATGVTRHASKDAMCF